MNPKDKNPIVYPHLNEYQESTTTGNFSSEQIALLSTLPFWINDPTEHANQYDDTNSECCFNHYVGLPIKNGKRNPLFDYQVHESYKGQQGLVYAFENNDCVYCLKATGIGFSDLTLRWMNHKAWTGSSAQYLNSYMIIVTGPNYKLATIQMDRIRAMYFDRLGVMFGYDKSKIVLPINNVTIQAFPSHNIASFRGLPKVSVVFIDEGDFFPIGQQVAVRDTAERYLGKSRAKIILGSTPYYPGGLMEKIQNEEKSIYQRIYLPYTVGINKIFTQEDIDLAKTSPSFKREYDLKYAYDIGDLMTETVIQKCLDIEYNPNNIVSEARKVIGIDPAYGGSSKFGIVVSQLVDGKIQILYAQDYERADPQEMEHLTLDLIRKYQMFMAGGRSNGQILVDGANVAFIKYLKRMLNENVQYEEIDQDDYPYMIVRPVNFGTLHRKMLVNMQQLASKGYLAIDKSFDSLLNQIRIAKVDANFGLIKKPLSLDLIDALRLNLFAYSLE
jgi:hypothetical protein